MNVPQHIAIILDGNDCAKSKANAEKLHNGQGAKNVEKIREEAWRGGNQGT